MARSMSAYNESRAAEPAPIDSKIAISSTADCVMSVGSMYAMPAMSAGHAPPKYRMSAPPHECPTRT